MESILAVRKDEFEILKSSDELMIGGYASIEIVDKQNDLITLDALKDAVQKFMEEKPFRNVMTNHSNVQVGTVVDSYRDKTGRLWKTEVDDVGFFVVIKLREDIEKAKEVQRGIRKGTLRSFSIGGQALRKNKKTHPELGQYNEISKLELHEVTICEKGINPEAKFDILKQDKGEKMTEELTKALEELDSLLKEMKGEKEMMEHAAHEEEKMGEYAMMEEEKAEEMMAYSEEEEKAEPATEDGEPEDRIVVDAGKPTHSAPVVKGFTNEELGTLDLSIDNIEKAYEAFRQEQLEALAYDNLKKAFEARFERESAERADILAKQNYDAASEVESLKNEFAELRKSLMTEKEEILKAQSEPAFEVPSLDQIADMDWSDIHRVARGN